MPGTSFIDVLVINRNVLTAHAVIGIARVPLQTAEQKGTETLQVPVQDKKGYGTGTVELRIKVTGVLSLLVVPASCFKLPDLRVPTYQRL
jgi:hypothetical protein